MLKKYGYGGKGLGKYEDGIIEPIKVQKKTRFGADDEKAHEHRPIIRRGLTSELLGGSGNLNSKRQGEKNTPHPWPKGTTLITGDSILCGVEEKRLSQGRAKVRVFLGATVDDMYDYLTPLLKKKPSNIILHIGSNDAPYKTSENIMNEIMDLKSNILSILPSVRIYLSCPTLRHDNAVANTVLRELVQKLKLSYKYIVVNDNVDRSCLGKKGLHLNLKGSGRLAMNYISLMRRL